MKSLALLSVAAMFGQALAATEQFNFVRAGYPTINMLAGIVALVMSAYYGYSTGGADMSQKSTRLFLFSTFVNTLTAIFFLFGPSVIAHLGFFMMFLSCVGLYYSFTEDKRAGLLWAITGFFIILAQLGHLQWLNFSSAVYDFPAQLCYAYFGWSQENKQSRCEGYMGLLRTFSLFSIWAIAGCMITVVSKLDFCSDRKESLLANDHQREPNNAHARHASESFQSSASTNDVVYSNI